MPNYILGLGGNCCADCVPDDPCSAKPTITACGSGTGAVFTAGTWSAYASGSNLADATWSISGAPSGITIDSVTGFVIGTPTTAGTFTFTVTATNECGSASCTFTLVVEPICTLSISLDSGSGTYNYDATGVFTVAHSYTIAITGAGSGCTNRIQFKADGTSLWDSTCIGGNASATVTVPAGTTTITVVWDHECGCSGCCDDNFVLIEGNCTAA